MGKTKNNMWMAITTDKYELPIAIGDTLKELAANLGVTENALCSNRSRKRNGKTNKYIVINIVLDEDDT